MSKTAFRAKLEKLINSESMENGSDTPDFILAEYLTDCLDVFDRTVQAREKWYGRQPKPVPTHECPQEVPGPMITPELCSVCGQAMLNTPSGGTACSDPRCTSHGTVTEGGKS